MTSPAQAALVGACSGASLPTSAITSFLTPVVTGIAAPVQTSVNNLLGVVGGIPLIGGLLPPLSIDTTGILANAVAGGPITLDVLKTDGTILGPADTCQSTADSFTLDTPAGIAIGGNSITGLGNGAAASAGTFGAIAFGNGATTTAGATDSIALGSGATASGANSVALGAGSTDDGAANVVSVGAAGAERRITNVAAGIAPTDAATVGQVAAAAGNAVQYDVVAGTRQNSATLVGGAVGPVTLGNVAPATLDATSTQAVNGSQLFATNGAVTNNTTAITDLTTNVNAGTIGTVQRTATPGSLALVAAGGTGLAPGAPQLLGNVADGALAAGSTDAVNGGQLFATNGNVTTNTTAITNLTNGTAGLVQQAGAGAPITVAAANDGTVVNVAGTAGARVLSGVADGVVGSDAATVAQLSAATGSALNAVNYDVVAGTRQNSVTLAGGAAGPVTITNVAPAALAAGSTDAVNGGQLFNTNSGIGGITGVVGGIFDPATGVYAGPTYTTVGGTTATTVQGAFNNYNSAIDGLTGGTIGLVTQATPTSNVLVAATSGGGAVDVTGTGGARQVLGVAAGSTAAGSTDAVNGGQVNTGLASIATSLGGGAAFDPATGTVTAPSYVVQGATFTDVGAALGALDTGTTGNTTAITNLSTTINNGTVGTVQRGSAADTLVLTAAGGSGAAPGAPQTLGNVAAGVAATDAANVGQVNAVGAQAANSVQYDTAGGARANSVTLAGGAAGPVTVTNVADGALTATSTDAVNGAQLAATNGQVTTNTANIATNTSNIAGNTTAISTLATNITNGSVGLVQQTGGAPGSGEITVGASTGGTSVSIAGTDGTRTLTGLSNGLGGTDAVTVAQVNGITGGALNTVQYDASPDGGRTNTITLTGLTADPVRITNLAAGTLAAGSTDAVTGGQLAATNAGLAAATTGLAATNAQVATNTGNIVTNTASINSILTGQAGAFRSNNAAGAAAPVASGANATAGGFGSSATGARGLALGSGAVSTGVGSVALGAGSTDGGAAGVVSVGSVGGERRITNVGSAVSGTDAVNLSQLQAASTQFSTGLAGVQQSIAGVAFDLNRFKKRANAGTAGAMAVAGLPQAFTPGAGMVAAAIGTWQDQVAFAVGASKIVSDTTVIKAGASFSTRGTGGVNAGVGVQF